MKLRFDRSVCTGHGRCYALAGEVFGEDEAGCCVPRFAELPPELEARARLAVDNCPEEALALED